MRAKRAQRNAAKKTSQHATPNRATFIGSLSVLGAERVAYTELRRRDADSRAVIPDECVTPMLTPAPPPAKSASQRNERSVASSGGSQG